MPPAPASAQPRTPILWLAAGLLCGQIVATATGNPAFPAAAATAAIAIAGRRQRSEAAICVVIAAAAAALGFIMLDGTLRPDFAAHHIARHRARDAEVRARVIGHPARRSSGRRFTIAVEALRRRGRWQPASGRVLLTARDAQRYWKSGDRFTARIRLREPRNFGNPGELDYERFLARRRIYRTAFAFSDSKWQRLPRRVAPTWSESVRQRARAALTQVASTEVRPIAAALLLGDGASIPPATRRRYARAGVSHVLAISGLHIGLIAAAAFATVRWLLARSERLSLRHNLPKAATIASLPPLLVYAAIAGASAATVRAAVMAVLFLTALLLDRARYWPATLAAAAAVICTATPGAMFDASFQLSFAAVIAIIAGAPRLQRSYDAWAERRMLPLRFPRASTLARWLALSQTVTLLALVATAPLTLHHFHHLSLSGVLSNLFIVPITGMAGVSIGLLGVLLTPALPGIGAVFLALCCGILTIGDWLTTAFARLPLADLPLPAPAAGEILAYYALLASPLIRQRRIRRFASALAALAIAIIAAGWIVERFYSDELRITFISVGQGESTLLELPGGHTILVDGGGLSSTFDTGERIVAPLLRRRKIRRIDTAIVTHPDYDHYGGLAYVAEHFDVGEIWSNGGRGRGDRFRDFQRRLDATGVPQRVVSRGFTATINGVRLAVLHPDDVDAAETNDSSIVLRLSYGGVGLLLTGDIERTAERSLLHRRDEVRATLLKVPHHGSRTSSTSAFLEAVRPCWAIVSSGYRNRYEMPHASVVARYAKRGIGVVRTDSDGAIEVRIAPSGTFQITRGHRRRHESIHSAASCRSTAVTSGKSWSLTGWEAPA